MNCDRMSLAGTFCILVVLGLCSPAAAAASGDREPAGIPGATVGLNVTNVSVASATFPAEYQLTPTLITLGYSTNSPLSGAPKGEMAAVPRSIGFSVSPAVLVIAIIIIAGAGIGYLVHRRRNTRKGE
jgi:hypothetical protein